MDHTIYTFLAAAWLAIAALAVSHILLNKRDPRGAALWIVITLLVPLAGAFLYWVLGINRIKRSSTVKARRKSARNHHATPRPEPATRQDKEPFTGLTTLMDASWRITGEDLLPGNAIAALYEGNRAFPAMLTAIGAAERSVNLSTYILDKDAVGMRIINALCSAARRGVQVRVLVDGVGTSRSAISMARRLRGAGARLAIFHPLLGLPVRRPSINMRNHRKLLIVDGRTGFTGGINISSRHFLTPWKKAALIRDVHFRVTGPVLASMQSVFAEDWNSSTGEVLTGDMFFPQIAAAGNALARAVSSGPDEDLEKIYQLILGALRSARKHVLIMTPYFIPDRAIIQALSSASLAGVRVDLLLPEQSDHPLVQSASMAYIPELMENRARVLLIPPPFVHSKLMVVDGMWSLIGSANIDPRSFRLNFEFDLEIYSREFAGEMLRYSEDMASGGTVLDMETFMARPLARRLMEGALKVFSPYL